MKQSPLSHQPSSPPRRTVLVPLGERSYQIVIGADLLGRAGELIRSTLGPHTQSVAVISNPTVFDRYGQRLTEGLAQAGFRVVTHLMADGERYKTLRTV